MLRPILAASTASALAYYLYLKLSTTQPAVLTSAVSEPTLPAAASSSSAAPVSLPADPPTPTPTQAQTPAAPPRSELHVLHSGGFAAEVADMLVAQANASSAAPAKIHVSGMADFKLWLTRTAALTGGDPPTAPLRVVFIVSTIENEQPPEDAGACTRFFQRRTHPKDMLSARLRYAVLGLGDSNLLLDRQTTTAKDCNQVARKLDQRLAELGAERLHALGETDDRTGNQELGPWLKSFVMTGLVG